MSAAQIKVRHKCFQDGLECVEADPCSKRPATSRTPESVERVRAAIHKDQRLTVRELEADLEILTQDLGMKCVMAKFVLWLLLPEGTMLPEQKEHRAAVANDLIQAVTNEPDFLKSVLNSGRDTGRTV